MVQRCTNPNKESYHNYGGRGIKIHPDWFDFRIFLADVGPRPSKAHSLDRINVDGNYEPGNVRWATSKEQALNRQVPVNIEKHKKRFRFQFEGIKYSFTTEEEARKVRLEMYEARRLNVK